MINKMILQGRITHTIEVKQLQDGTEVCNFTVANSIKYGEKERKLFLNCTAWRKTAELMGNYFHKGQEIIVEGEIYQREYVDKNENKRTIIEMPSVDKVHFCGPKQTEHSATPEPAGDIRTVLEETEEEMPF